MSELMRGGEVDDHSEYRIGTIILACFSIASVLLFVAVYGPPALDARPGATFRAMRPLPLIAAIVGCFGWIGVTIMGLRQLFFKPRVYGLIWIGIGVFHFLAYRLAQWILMDSRGITWGS